MSEHLTHAKLLKYIKQSVGLFIVAVILGFTSNSPNSASATIAGILILVSVVVGGSSLLMLVGQVNYSKYLSYNKNVLHKKRKILKDNLNNELVDQETPWRPNKKFVILVCVVLFLVLRIPVSNGLTIKFADLKMVQLAKESGMNTKGEVLFLRTNPILVSDSQMAVDCSANTAANNSNGFIEQGCYDPNTNRIFIRQMPDDLHDLEVVTAAYEMLHVVYLNNVSSGNSTALNKSIEDNFLKLSDATLNSRVSAFAKTEPTYRDLELFSLLPTGYAGISPDLLAYISPYFDDISKTYGSGNKVEQLFTSDKNALVKYQADIDLYSGYADNAYSNAQTAYRNSVSWAYSGNQYMNDYNYNIYLKDFDIYKQDLVLANTGVDNYNKILAEYNNLVTEYNGSQPVANVNSLQTKSASQ